jgi:peroxiredoxin
MKNVKKVFKTFIPFIAIACVIVLLAFVSQLWAEVKEEPAEVQFVSSSK